LFLTLDNALADVPVQVDQLAVGGKGRLKLGGADAILEIAQQGIVALGQCNRTDGG
jgi:hypothetical protein